MSIYHIHYNETIFEDPRLFDPNRWIKPANEIEKQLKFMVAFSRGSRVVFGNQVRLLVSEYLESLFSVTADY